MHKANDLYSRLFIVNQEVTWGRGALSPHIFIRVVEIIVPQWLRYQLGETTATLVIGEQIQQLLSTFYANDYQVQ